MYITASGIFENITTESVTASGNITAHGDVAILNGSALTLYSDGNDKMLSIIHNDTDGIIDVSDGALQINCEAAGGAVIFRQADTLGIILETDIANDQNS